MESWHETSLRYRNNGHGPRSRPHDHSHAHNHDVIYSNLGLSSKLTRYALTVGGVYMGTSIMETYDKIIALEVTESTPLGDWIRLLLRNSEFVFSRGKGSKNVVVELQNVKDLNVGFCDSLNIHCQNNIPFPKLERLEVSYCDHLRHLFRASLACPDDEEEVTLLRALSSLCYGKCISGDYQSSKISGQEPTMQSPTQILFLMKRGLLNLRTLWIQECQSMEEVITEEEQQGEEIMCNEPLFPGLEELKLVDLPKLGHFILTRHALEFPFLKVVVIYECHEMKTFIQPGTVSTLNLESVNNDDELKVIDLNKAMFNSKVCLVPLYN
ncbi:hypothetical protein BC332_26785 [Capsicum chinense]|nr:hypothetical protein BC332_26785 [Capsicum chinense]